MFSYLCSLKKCCILFAVCKNECRGVPAPTTLFSQHFGPENEYCGWGDNNKNKIILFKNEIMILFKLMD